MNLGDTSQNKKLKIIITLLIIIALALLVISRFSIWRKHVTEQTWEYGPDNIYIDTAYSAYEYGLYYEHLYGGDSLDDLDYDYINYWENLSEWYNAGSPALLERQGLMTTGYYCLLSIAGLIVLLISWVFACKYNRIKMTIILSFVSSILILIMLVQFITIYPLAYEYGTFSGKYVYSGGPEGTVVHTWGPSLGFYLSVLSLILIIFVIIILIWKRKNFNIIDTKQEPM